MTQRRGLLLLGLAAFLALLAMLLTSGYIGGVEARLGERSLVVVAAQEIKADTPLAEGMLTVATVPTHILEANAPGYFGVLVRPLDAAEAAPTDGAAGRQRLNELLRAAQESRGNVAAVDVPKGAIFLPTYLKRPVARFADQELAPGFRAVSLKVDDVTGVAGTLQKGDRVDIVASYTEQQAVRLPGPDQGASLAGQGANRTVLLLENVLVIKVGGAATGPGAAQRPGELVVTFGLATEDALRLAYMENFGKQIRLLSRRGDDTTRPRLPSVEQGSFR